MHPPKARHVAYENVTVQLRIVGQQRKPGREGTGRVGPRVRIGTPAADGQDDERTQAQTQSSRDTSADGRRRAQS